MFSGHSARTGAAKDMLLDDAGIGQIMAKLGWIKVNTMMEDVGVEDITALNSVARSGDLTLIRQD